MSKTSPRIVIIGAGLIGLSAADALLTRGCRVTVLEARSGPVRGTSFANSGMIHPSQSRSWAKQAELEDPSAATAVTRDLAERSQKLLLERMEDLDLNEALKRPAGCYQIFPDIAARADAQAVYVGDEVNVEMPDTGISAEAFGYPALFFPDDRSANAREYGLALARSIETRGGLLIYDADRIKLSRGAEERVSVSMGSHIFAADHVILAAGAQTGTLLSPFQIDLPVRSVRGWAVDFDWPETRSRDLLPDVPVMDAISRSAFTPFLDTFRLSGTWGEERVDPLLRRWAEIMPSVMKQVNPPRAVWSGLRPVCDLGRPIIGGSGIDGLWINTGHGHLGWTLCAGSGLLMAEMILDGVRDERYALPSSLPDDQSPDIGRAMDG